MEQYTIKIKKFCLSGKVGTMLLSQGLVFSLPNIKFCNIIIQDLQL